MICIADAVLSLVQLLKPCDLIDLIKARPNPESSALFIERCARAHHANRIKDSIAQFAASCDV